MNNTPSLIDASHWPTIEAMATVLVNHGSGGTNRHAGSPMGRWGSEVEAVQAWLSHYRSSPSTHRAYEREAERLLLWTYGVLGSSLSNLGPDDLQAFFEFLEAPADAWVNENRCPRSSPTWRPLRGPLRGSSLRQTRTIINTLFSWMVETRYLAGNPCALTRQRNVTALGRPTRYLRHDAWEFFLLWIEQHQIQGSQPQAARLRLLHLATLFYLTAARLSDVSGSTMGDLRQDEDGSWWWYLVGKGGKAARIPASTELMDSVARYRRFYGLGPRPTPGESTPLVFHLGGPTRGRMGLTSNMIYRILRQAFVDSSQAATEQGLSDIAANLAEASTHWLRHTSLSHQVNAGIDLITVRDNARHASLSTTSRYLWAEDSARHAQTVTRHRLRGY